MIGRASSPDAARTGLGPMTRRALSDEVTDLIREAIVAGRLEAGRRIREEELAGSLQVSRGTVRESLLRLSSEGLIERHRHRGASVIQLGRADVVEIYTLRTALERLACEWVCRDASPAELRALRERSQAFAAGREDPADIATRELAFHGALFAAAHHERLEREWSALRSQTHYLILRTPAELGDPRARRRAHLELVEALESRDRVQADRVIIRHVTASSRRVLRTFPSVEAAPPAEAGSALGDLGLTPAQRRATGEEVADRIREAIAAGTLPPRAWLREDELAAELQVSRGPVREAILRLAEEGLVRHERHRGATVVELTERDVHELFSLRGALERLATGLACGAATDAEIEHLQALLEQAPSSGDLTRLDVAFHDALFLASHHRRLYRAWHPLRGQISLFLGVEGVPGRTVAHHRWRLDHEQLVNLLAERDATALQAMITDHVEQTHERALYRLQDLRTEGPRPEGLRRPAAG